MRINSESLQVRLATSSDADLMAEYRLRFNLELSPPQTPETIERLRADLTAYFRNHTDNGDFISVIAFAGDAVAGIGSMEPRIIPGNFKNPSGRWGFILNMYTVPEYRRHGVARTILDKLIETGLQQGLTAFELLATKEGQPVYEKAGFEIFPSPCMRYIPAGHED